MKTYSVLINYGGSVEFLIEAEDESKAEELAFDKYYAMDSDELTANIAYSEMGWIKPEGEEWHVE